jgi:hypothetical protein
MNRVSGKALVQNTRRSDLCSFEFIDGFSDALQLTWEMLIDMIPTVYDSERVERIIGHDGVEKMVTINGTQEGQEDLINDLSKGTYDVEVTIGPSFQTARQEALDTLIAMSEAMPNSAPLIADLMAKNVDTPDAQEMARRLRIPLIQQGIIQPTDAEKQANPSLGQPTPAQQQQQKMQQDEAALLAAKKNKMEADAQIANSRAQISDVEQQKQRLETVGKHLGNLKMQGEISAQHQEAAAAAQEQQTQAQSDMMDLAAKHVGHQQDMTHAAHAAPRQGLVHEHQQTRPGCSRALRARAEQRREQEKHEAREEKR